jgi:hypothetical protein
MDSRSPGMALDRMYGILRWSLPIYLQDSRPWRASRDDAACRLLDAAAADFASYAERLATAARELRWQIAPGGFPLRFTSLHDCSALYLAGLAAERLQNDLAEIERCVATLAPWTEYEALAEEVLGNARGHLEQLREVSRPRKP